MRGLGADDKMIANTLRVAAEEIDSETRSRRVIHN
jgi:hypothetical protein